MSEAREFGTASQVDPETDPVFDTTGGSMNILAELEKELGEDEPVEPVTIPIKIHSNVGVRYNCNIDADTMARWRRKWTHKRTEEFDTLRFSITMIANQCEQIIFKGQEPSDSTGNPLTFRSRDVWNMVGASDAQDCVMKFFRRDPHIIATAMVISEQAGYNMDPDDIMDPTSTE